VPPGAEHHPPVQHPPKLEYQAAEKEHHARAMKNGRETRPGCQAVLPVQPARPAHQVKAPDTGQARATRHAPTRATRHAWAGRARQSQQGLPGH
jgi:hypothetical protein